MPDSIKRLFDVEKDPRADLLPFQGGGYSINESVTTLDGGVEYHISKIFYCESNTKCIPRKVK